MIRNHLLIALRSFRRSPLYFIINVTGFSLGLLACVLILRYVTYEYSYDDQAPEDIYRVTLHDRDGGLASSPVPTGPALVEELSMASEFVRFAPLRGLIKPDTESSGMDIEQVVIGDGDFQSFFGLNIIEGDITLMHQPGQIFISQSLSKKLFRNEPTTGKEILLFESNFGEMSLNIAGVYQDQPGNTHVPLEGIVSLPTLELYNQQSFWAKADNWGWNSFFTYVRLSNLPALSETNRLLDKYVGQEYRESQDLRVVFQPINEIHTSSGLENEYTPTRDPLVLNFLLLMAVFILIIAAVNYINLTSAKGLQRAKEVGLRKNMGASRWELIRQFNLEAGIIFAVSLLIALTIYQVIIPVIMTYMGQGLSEGWSVNELLVVIVFVVPIIVWSAWQPSWMISAFSIREVVQGKIQFSKSGKTFRQGSVIIQMSIAIILLFSVILVNKQVRYMQNIELGINIDRLLVVERPKESGVEYGKNSQAFENALRQMSIVENVSVSGGVPGGGYNWSTNALKIKGSPDNVKETSYNVTYIDNNYVDTYSAEMVAGTGFYLGEDNTLKVLINTAASEALGFSTPDEAIDAILVNGETEVKVIGVMANYFHETARQQISPTVFMIDRNPQFFTIRYQVGDQPLEATQSILIQTASTFDTYFPEKTFQYFFPDDLFYMRYSEERNLGTLVTFFCGLAILLCSMGLIGLSMYTLESRRKEMGIRKILGASSLKLFSILSGGFVRLVVLSAIPALPASIFLAMKWLENYPNKVPFGWWYFLLPIVLLFFISIASVSYQLYQLSTSDAIESIRYE